MHEDEKRLGGALARYRVISANLALDTPRGQREATRKQLAAKTWTGPDGEPFTVESETIRAWVRRYRKEGLTGLDDKPRPCHVRYAPRHPHVPITVTCRGQALASFSHSVLKEPVQ